ncbi:hypothetical protein [Enterobacter sp. PTB]|uniref:hypothetical protein n=1 Tax=Enterobacter sp. PTB TaxID=3143437 RepID=UPI003DA8F58F
MNKIFFICLFIVSQVYAGDNFEISSKCGGRDFKILSNCKVNNLRSGQAEMDNPECTMQTLFINNKKIELSPFSGMIKRENENGEEVSMMQYVFYNAYCIQNKALVLASSGGCNACGEKFIAFDLGGIQSSIPSGSLENGTDILPDRFFMH